MFVRRSMKGEKCSAIVDVVIAGGGLSRRSFPTSETPQGRCCAARTLAGYYLARKFLLRTQGFFFTSAITSLPRKAVPATPRSDPCFSFSLLSRSLSLSLSLPPFLPSSLRLGCRPFFFFLWHRFTCRDEDPPGTLRERRGARVSGTLSLLPLSKASLLCTVFHGKSS